MSELILLAVLALIIIGPKQLPEVARTLGRLINDIKRSTAGLSDEIKKQAGMDFEIDDFMNQRKKSAQTDLLKKALEEEELEKLASPTDSETGSSDSQMTFDVEPKSGAYVSEETRKGHGENDQAQTTVNKKDDSNG